MQEKQVYSNLKIFHYQDKIDSLPEENKLILSPIQIRIKPINACNHNCAYCCYRADSLRLGQDMNEKDMIPEGKMEELLEDIIEMQVKSVTFSGGGEPLVYPYIRNAFKTLATSGIKFATLTNGSNLSGEAADILGSYGSWVRVSIDGWNSDSYAKYRNVALSEFEKVLSNIKWFSKIKKECKLGAVIIIDKKNFKHIYNLTQKLRDCGVDNLKMSPCITSNNAQENNHYHQDFFDYAQEEINRAILDFSSKDFKIMNAYHLLNGKFKKAYEWCPFLQVRPVIGADCNVYSCQDKAYELDSGLLFSIKNIRFKDAWFSDKNNFFKIRPKHDCLHHCVSNTQNQMIMEYLSVDHEEFV